MPVYSSGSRRPGRPCRAFRLAYFDARPEAGILKVMALASGGRLPLGRRFAGAERRSRFRRCSSIAAASILAKTHRDAFMKRAALEFPGYGWEKNAGYPTVKHKEAIKELGTTNLHRMSFKHD